MSIVLYAGHPYEKRLNLSPTAFRRLVDCKGDILEYYYHVESDCLRGQPIIKPLMITVSADHNIYAVVTAYRGKGKVHVGSRTYCDILMTKVEDAGYTFVSSERPRALHPDRFLRRTGRDDRQSRSGLDSPDQKSEEKRLKKNFPLILSILIVAAAKR